jgi:hypothetical protein
MNIESYLEEKLNEALAGFFLSPSAGTEFVKEQLRIAVAELHRLAKTVRGARSLATTKNWRVASNLTQELLSVGQRYASILWMAGMRDTITDKIERVYGICFSSLGVMTEVRDNEGGTAFLAYDAARLGGKSYTMIKNGEYLFIPVEDYNKRFSPLS